MLLQNLPVVQKTHPAMGTIMTHKAFGTHAVDCLEAVGAEVSRVEDLLSRFIASSDVGRINRSAGVRCEQVSFETMEVLLKAVDFSRKCPGCFDITIAPLVSLWKNSQASSSAPELELILAAQKLVDYRDLSLDPVEMTAGLTCANQSIDLGGIGKGYAGDLILEVYRAYGIESAYSNLGGNVVTVGLKPNGSPWLIGIQNPRQEEKIVGTVAVENRAVVTSGDYQRFYIDRQGRRRHHILNPETGYPAESGLTSVTVVSPQSIEADALSTILFVAGIEKGRTYLKKFPQVEAIFIDTDLKVSITAGLEYRFLANDGIGVQILN